MEFALALHTAAIFIGQGILLGIEILQVPQVPGVLADRRREWLSRRKGVLPKRSNVSWSGCPLFFFLASLGSIGYTEKTTFGCR